MCLTWIIISRLLTPRCEQRAVVVRLHVLHAARRQLHVCGHGAVARDAGRVEVRLAVRERLQQRVRVRDRPGGGGLSVRDDRRLLLDHHAAVAAHVGPRAFRGRVVGRLETGVVVLHGSCV